MKCSKCGLMQARQATCRRCGNPFESAIESRVVAQTHFENPYAPPVASPQGKATPDLAPEIFRDGEMLVVRDGTRFPDRCVRCNKETDVSRLWKTFYWHSPGWYALVLLNLILYAIVAMSVRKKASFELALCSQHRSRRQWCFAIAFGLPIVAFMAMMATEASMLGFWAFLLALLFGAIVGIVGAQVLTCTRIDGEYAYLKGAHPRFLASLPTLR
jgi:hypothetical protein